MIEEAVTYEWFRYVTALRSSSDTQERNSQKSFVIPCISMERVCCALTEPVQALVKVARASEISLKPGVFQALAFEHLTLKCSH